MIAWLTEKLFGHWFNTRPPAESTFHSGGIAGPRDGLRDGEIPAIISPGLELPVTRATQLEQVDIEKLIGDTVARWHGDEFDRRPLAKVLTETLRPYLKSSAVPVLTVTVDSCVDPAQFASIAKLMRNRERFDRESG